MEKWVEEHAQLTHQCLRCARMQGAGWVPFDTTVLRGQSRVSTAQGLAFFLPDCFLSSLCLFLLFRHLGNHSPKHK